MSRSLYTIYRPMNFDEVIGQDIIKKILINSLKKQDIKHAYLFHGIRGVGKTTLARIFSKALNCENLQDGFNPCNQCESCKAVNTGSSLSVIEIDAATNNSVDDVREIVDRSNYAIVDGKYKVYIIDEVHMFSKSAFNSLLKTLEEPPKGVVFLLATTEINKIPETILSRTIILNLESITNDQIKETIVSILTKESLEYEQEALDYIVINANGSLRDAITITQSCILYNNNLTVDNVCHVLKIIKTSHLKELIHSNPTKLIEMLNNGQLDVNRFKLQLLELLSGLKTNTEMKVFKAILNASFNYWDPTLLKIFLVEQIKTLANKEENVEKHLHEIIVPRETITPKVEAKQPEITEKKHTENTQVVPRETITIDPTISRTLEHTLGKHVSKNVDENSTKKSITDYVSQKHYLTLLYQNEKERWEKYKQRWIYLSNYYKNEKYRKYLKLLSETHILAATNWGMVLGFPDEIMVEEFKKISLEAELYNLIQDVIGAKIALLPVHKENWSKLLQVAKQAREKGFIINEKIDIDHILKNTKTTNDELGKLVFGDKLQ